MSPFEILEQYELSYPGGKPEEADIDANLRRYMDNDMGYVLHSGSGYPSSLIDIPDPPAVLFFAGELEKALQKAVVAVIGSRRSSVYGLGVARSLSRALSSSGVCVVSGLARGIDGEAHRGSIEGGGPTIAVLGSGIDVLYPPEHSKLSLGIIAGDGALVSEYPPGTRPDRFNFPERNRIISGLSRGVIVVEAGEKSGTMITVNSALDQGREVFAVPGEVTRSTSSGTNRLLKEGAHLVTSVEDVLEVLGIRVKKQAVSRLREVEGEVAVAVVQLLVDTPLHFDEIVRKLELDPGALQAELLMLEMQGHVVRRPGEIYTLL